MFAKFIKKLIAALKTFVRTAGENEPDKVPVEKIPEAPLEDPRVVQTLADLDVFWYGKEAGDVQ